MANQTPLRMELVASTETIRGVTYAWVDTTLTAVEAFGLTAHVIDSDNEGGAVLRVQLNDITDAPRCEHCERVCLDLEDCDGEWRCAACAEPDGPEYDAPDSRDGEVDDGPMTTGCYMRRLGRVGY